jgi:methyl-accepting chemotaxis protein
MKTTTATPFQEVPRAAPRWRLPLAALLLAGGLYAAWFGAWLGLLGAAATLASLGLLLWPLGSVGEPAGSPAKPAVQAVVATGAGTRQGAEVMVSQVVPVWSRQLEVTREAASDGLSALLQSFADISQQLSTLSGNLANFSVSASPGSIDNAVRTESPALKELTAASSRAFAERDAVVAALGQCADGLTELQHLSKQARELARHTRLVAFNASIESNRAHSGSGSGSGGSSAHKQAEQGGKQAVAGELRMLAGRIAENSENIERIINGLAVTVRKAHREGEVTDTSADELQLEIDISARRAMAALLGAMGTSMQSSTEVKQTAEALNAQLEASFMHFQFGDRVSQMLSIVGNDMTNFAQWVAANPRASQTDAAEWLVSLEASYTMEEQRSSHHGNAHVETGAAVEFF